MVRLSALQALGQTAHRCEDVRDRLLTTLQDPQEAPAVKQTALQVVESYPLADQSYQMCMQFKRADAR